MFKPSGGYITKFNKYLDEFKYACSNECSFDHGSY